MRRISDRIGVEPKYFKASIEGRPVQRTRLEAIAIEVHDSYLADLAASDVLWDRVSTIASLGEQPTYDATVGATHNFLANGIVLHNSLEQDADVVMFIYRDEVYNPESEDRGKAEIHIAKHRNGPTGLVELAFRPDRAEFKSMAQD